MANERVAMTYKQALAAFYTSSWRPIIGEIGGALADCYNALKRLFLAILIVALKVAVLLTAPLSALWVMWVSHRIIKAELKSIQEFREKMEMNLKPVERDRGEEN